MGGKEAAAIPMLGTPKQFPAELLPPPMHTVLTPDAVLKVAAARGYFGVPSIDMLLECGLYRVSGMIPNLVPGVDTSLVHAQLCYFLIQGLAKERSTRSS